MTFIGPRLQVLGVGYGQDQVACLDGKVLSIVHVNDAASSRYPISMARKSRRAR